MSFNKDTRLRYMIGAVLPKGITEEKVSSIYTSINNSIEAITDKDWELKGQGRSFIRIRVVIGVHKDVRPAIPESLYPYSLFVFFNDGIDHTESFMRGVLMNVMKQQFGASAFSFVTPDTKGIVFKEF